MTLHRDALRLRVPMALAALAMGCAHGSLATPGAPAAAVRTAPAPIDTAAAAPDSVTAERNRYAEQAMVLVKGRENAPVESVFRNLKVLGGFPASRLIPVMNLGWGRALGVSCTHCHVPGRWASDAKAPKAIARDMVRMGATISKALAGMEGLNGRQPIVNCTTCHRGSLKPALDLP